MYSADEKELLRMSEELLTHDKLYYKDDSPLITDQEYDMLRKRYEELSKKLKYDPYGLGRVGNDKQSLWPVRQHLHRMYSLDNVYSEAELEDWMLKIQKQTGYAGPYIVELKYDGVSVEMVLGEKTISFVTRGDGLEGEDVSARAATLLYSQTTVLPDTAATALYAEVVLTKKGFNFVNSRRPDGKLFVSPRNAISGLLRAKRSETSVLEEHHARILPYAALVDGRIELYGEYLTKIMAEDVSGCIETITMQFGGRDVLDYDIDGLVFKVADPAIREELGYTQREPRWAIAYKYEEQVSSTRIEAIDIQVGRTGVITPLARIHPVTVGDVTVTSATLHNFDEIDRLQLSVGDRVVIKRAGDVIPKITGKLESTTPYQSQRPFKCPSCGSPLVTQDAMLYCTNIYECKGVATALLQYQFGKTMLDFKGIGPSVIHNWTNNYGLAVSKTIRLSDIFSMTHEQRKHWSGLTEVQYARIADYFDKKKEIEEAKLIALLGIRLVGRRVAAKLLSKGLTIQQLIDDPHILYRLPKISSIGSETIESIATALTQTPMHDELKRLVHFFHLKPTVVYGRSVAVTGSLDVPRAVLETVLREAGYALVSPGKDIHALLVGDKPSQKKVEKCAKYGVRIISTPSIKDALRLLEDH